MNEIQKNLRLNDSFFLTFFIISGKRTRQTIYELFLRETFRLSSLFFSSFLNKYLSLTLPFSSRRGR